MSDAPTQRVDYCSSLLREQDEDRWLAAKYAKAPLQNALLALGALRLELRRIPAQVSEPPLGEIRLQWWREGLEAIQAGGPARAHPVLQFVETTTLRDKSWAPRLDAIIDASSRPLYGEGFSSVEDLAGWLLQTEGALDGLAAQLAGGDEALGRAAAKAGAAFALAREGRALAPNLAGDISRHATGLYEEASPLLSKAPPETAPACLHLSLTPFYLQKGLQRAPLFKRIKLFSAMAFARF